MLSAGYANDIVSLVIETTVTVKRLTQDIQLLG